MYRRYAVVAEAELRDGVKKLATPALRCRSVPILYLGAEGGVGTLGDYTSSLTASDDVTNVNVQVLPGGQTPVDYGHADLFIGNDAERLAWDTLRRWIVEHSRPRRSYGKRTTP